MKRSSFTDLIIALALTAAVLGAYLYWYAALTEASAEAALLASRIAEKSGDASRIAAAKTILATLSSEEAAMREYFVSTEDIVSFLEGLEATGKKSGARASVVSVSAGVTDSRDHILIAVKINGGFDAVLRTLGVIEYSPHDIVVTNLSFNAVPDAKSEWEAVTTFAIGTRSSSVLATGTSLL